jgi:hypothetical protein
MKLKQRTVSHLASIICGDVQNCIPYRSGPMLVKLFNEYGADDVYGSGFPSRHSYTEEKLRALNGTPAMKKIVEEVLNPVEFIDERFNLEDTVIKFNKYLEFDGYKVSSEPTQSIVLDLSGQIIDFKIEEHQVDKLSHEYISKQIEKCHQKLSSADYDGAITNARSLAEAVLINIEKQFDQDAPECDGDLIKLYRRVQKHLNLTPENSNLDATLKQILSGLTSVVTGLAGMRNKMSDAHASSHQPSKHHALLAINSSKTLCDFLYDTLDYQKKK